MYEELSKEIRQLKETNEVLRNNCRKSNQKENSEAKSLNSKNKEITELKMTVSKYEEEIIKLKANLKYAKKEIQNKTIPDNEIRDEANWKNTCLVY